MVPAMVIAGSGIAKASPYIVVDPDWTMRGDILAQPVGNR